MAVNPMPVILQGLFWTAWIGLMTGVGISQLHQEDIEDCNGIVSLLTLCNGAFQDMIGIVVLGTIPGAPALVNLCVGFVGVYARGTVIWAIFQLARGSG